jgi:hypothetical protein
MRNIILSVQTDLQQQLQSNEAKEESRSAVALLLLRLLVKSWLGRYIQTVVKQGFQLVLRI